VKKKFDRVVDELRQRGCEAGGIRMRAETGADHRVCERRFYRDWHLVFGDEDDIVISWVADMARTRTYTQMAQRRSPHSVVSAVVALNNQRAATISMSRRPTRNLFSSSIRSVQRADLADAR
jgi:hypothetical protein